MSPQRGVRVPGSKGVAIAFVAEAVISFGLMGTVLAFSSSVRLARFTGLVVGCLVAFFISVESPLPPRYGIKGATTDRAC